MTSVQKATQKRLKISCNIVFGVYAAYILLVMMFPNLSPLFLNMFLAIDVIVFVGSVKDLHIMRSETIKQMKEKQNCESQLDKGFESLKEAAISYLNRITKTTTNFNFEEKHYIEVIEKGFQKRIGTYPQQ